MTLRVGIASPPTLSEPAISVADRFWIYPDQQWAAGFKRVYDISRPPRLSNGPKTYRAVGVRNPVNSGRTHGVRFIDPCINDAIPQDYHRIGNELVCTKERSKDGRPARRPSTLMSSSRASQ